MDAVCIRGLLVYLSVDSPQSLHHPMESIGCDSNDNSLRNMIIANTGDLCDSKNCEKLKLLSTSLAMRLPAAQGAGGITEDERLLVSDGS